MSKQINIADFMSIVRKGSVNEQVLVYGKHARMRPKARRAMRTCEKVELRPFTGKDGNALWAFVAVKPTYGSETTYGDCLIGFLDRTHQALLKAVLAENDGYAPEVELHFNPGNCKYVAVITNGEDGDIPDALFFDYLQCDHIPGIGKKADAGNGRKAGSHLRRGHFHRYWVGPKDGERELVTRWVEPVIVGA